MITIGQVGLGHWGPNVLRNFIHLANCRVKVCCDLDEGALAKVQSSYPDLRTTCDYSQLLEDPEIDAIVVTASARAHYRLAKGALEQGKHVFVEKPLALQVAGRLLQAEAESGFGVDALLEELRAGARLLDETAPPDRADLAAQTTPTIAALLCTSTDYLDGETRAAFARLCAFPPKPATFDLAAFEAVCCGGVQLNALTQLNAPTQLNASTQMNIPTPNDLTHAMVRTLVDRGLMEKAGANAGRWQLHALLMAHARSLLDDAQHQATCLRHAQHYERVLRSATKLAGNERRRRGSPSGAQTRSSKRSPRRPK